MQRGREGHRAAERSAERAAWPEDEGEGEEEEGEEATAVVPPPTTRRRSWRREPMAPLLPRRAARKIPLCARLQTPGQGRQVLDGAANAAYSPGHDTGGGRPRVLSVIGGGIGEFRGAAVRVARRRKVLQVSRNLPCQLQELPSLCRRLSAHRLIYPTGRRCNSPSSAAAMGSGAQLPTPRRLEKAQAAIQPGIKAVTDAFNSAKEKAVP